MFPWAPFHPRDDAGSAYDHVFQSVSGEDLPLARFRGQVMLVVNTASRCGFTPQYAGLEALYRRHGPRGLVVIGVPSDDFGGQEPGTNAEIAAFCAREYRISFPLTAKVHVKGSQAHPFYRWARRRFGFTGAPKWNFHKYLVDRQGRLVDFFHSLTAPESPRLIAAIERALA